MSEFQLNYNPTHLAELETQHTIARLDENATGHHKRQLQQAVLAEFFSLDVTDASRAVTTFNVFLGFLTQEAQQQNDSTLSPRVLRDSAHRYLLEFHRLINDKTPLNYSPNTVLPFDSSRHWGEIQGYPLTSLIIMQTKVYGLMLSLNPELLTQPVTERVAALDSLKRKKVKAELQPEDIEATQQVLTTAYLQILKLANSSDSV